MDGSTPAPRLRACDTATAATSPALRGRRPAVITRPSAAESSTRFVVGALVADRYRIVRLLGRGGMGEVYEAYDLDTDARIAIKTLLPERSCDADAEERLEREFLLASRISHRGVCRVLELGLDPTTGALFVTMELLRGETLADRLLRTGRMAPSEALPLVRQLAAGLAAAHEVGVVHRDFKIQNVILSDDEHGPRAVITDFGLARLGASAARVSATDYAGTPAYMAPEQITQREVTPAADLYALGVVMFEMLTGSLPFTGINPLEIALARLHVEPRRLSDLLDDADPRWDAVIERCLRRDPGARYPSALDVADALDRTPMRSRPRRSWLAAVAAAVVLAAGVVGGQAARVDAQPAPADLAPSRPLLDAPSPLRPERRPACSSSPDGTAGALRCQEAPPGGPVGSLYPRSPTSKAT